MLKGGAAARFASIAFFRYCRCERVICGSPSIRTRIERGASGFSRIVGAALNARVSAYVNASLEARFGNAGSDYVDCSGQ